MPKTHGNSKRLHVSVREDLYDEIIKDIEDRYSTFSATINMLIERYLERKKSISEDR